VRQSFLTLPGILPFSTGESNRLPDLAVRACAAAVACGTELFMSPHELPPDLPPEEQLRLLENAYAELLMDDMDAKVLTALWLQIKELRNRLELPIYGYVTPREQRN
jgi:hypothetical protein